MYGAGIGTLNVYYKPSNGSMNTKTLVWTLSGNHGNVWSLGRAPVSISQPYQIIFEGRYIFRYVSLSQRSPFNLWGQYFTFVAVFLLHLFIIFWSRSPRIP